MSMNTMKNSSCCNAGACACAYKDMFSCAAHSFNTSALIAVSTVIAVLFFVFLVLIINITPALALLALCGILIIGWKNEEKLKAGMAQ